MARQRRPPETLTQAAARMRREGYSQRQIAGQIRKWNPLMDIARSRETAAPPPPSTPTSRKQATVAAGKLGLAPWDIPAVPKTLPSVKGLRAAPPTKREQSAELDRQYRLAKSVAVDTGARRKLAKTLTTSERQHILDPSLGIREARAREAARPPGVLGILGGTLSAEGRRILRDPSLLVHPERFLTDPIVGELKAGAHASPAVLHATQHYISQQLQSLIGIAAQRPSSFQAAGWRQPVATQAAGVPTPEQLGEILVPIALGGAKIGVAGASAIRELQRDPVGSIPRIVGQGVGALSGVTQMIGLAGLAMDPRISTGQRNKLLSEVGKAGIDYYVQTYGPDATFSDAIEHGKEDQFNAILDAAGLASVGARGLTIFNAFRKGEMTLGAAYRAMHTPAKGRQLRLQVEGGAPKYVEGNWAQSPLTRTLVNRPYDLISRAVDATPLLKRLPIAERKRAARVLDRQHRRMMNRLPAHARAVFRDVSEAVKEHPEWATALATMLQKPKGFTQEEWMSAVITDLKEMIGGRSFISPESETPGVRRLMNRIRVYEQRGDRARAQRRSRASHNVGREQERLADALDGIGAERRQVMAEMRQLNEDTALDEAEKATRQADLQQELRTLNTQARIAREELDGITVTQEPIEHSSRTELQQQLEAHPNFQNENAGAVDDVLAVTDARARVWAGQTGRPASEWYDRLAETRTVAPNEIPTEGRVLYQTARDEAHVPRVVYPEAKMAARRRSKLSPRKGTATGVPTTRNLWTKTDEGVRFKLAGDVTPKDWVQRVLAVIPTAEGRDALARWYEHYKPMFTKAFGKDADRIMRGFAVSQANASPSSGLTAVLKVIDILDRGGEVGPRQISVVGEAIAKAVRDEEIDKFIAAKLSDFIDSLAGRTTRTWMGKAAEGGSPSAVDVHAIRDRGFIDRKLVKRLTGRGYRLGKDFTVEGRGAATGPLYERIAEWYHDIADHLNEMNNGEGFDGRNDWTPAQAQALGWSSIQIAHKVIPEGFAEAFANNTRAITFEVTRGPLGLGNDLTPAQTRRVADSMESAAKELVADTPGIWLRDVKVGVGGWEQGTNANISVRVLGSKEAVQSALSRFAKAFDQEWVQATREVTGKNSRATLLVDSPKFRDPRTRARFFRALNRIEPRLEGFMDYSVDGVPGLAIRTNSPSVSPKNAEAFVNRYRAAIEQAEAETGIEVSGSVRNMEMLTGGQHGEVAPIHTLAGSGGGLARGALDDPLAARIRTELEAGIDRERAAAGGAPEQRGVTRAQTRQGDLLGAVQFLDTDAGKRILYLTPNSDVSTVLHELVGHATDEMHALYPQEFAAVEDVMGRPYADWTVDDHERFASWSERYFHDGLAPTPELAGVMDRIKGWMRSIYEGMRRALGEQLPVATRTLFDSYFGAYDDENVARIALNMGHEGWGREDLAIQRYGGAEQLTRQQLQGAKRSAETRRYKRSLDGMTDRLDELSAKADWTAEEFGEYQQLSADILTREAANAIKADKREISLRAKVSDLEAALKSDLDSPKFQAALEAMRWIADDRERILRESFGDQYDAVFSNRRDLLADWLVERGLLAPNFEQGSARYFPVTMEEPSGVGARVKGISAAIARPVVGKTKTDLLKLHKRNNMIAWQRGDWTADPSVLLEAHTHAQAYAYANHIKRTLYEIGRPLTRVEARDLPDNVFLINLQGTPLGPELRSQLNSKTTTLDAQRVIDGVDGADNERLENSVKGYINSFMIDPAALPPGFNALNYNDLRVVPKELIEILVKPVRGANSVVGRGADIATTMSRWALIYGNVPGYMLTNGLGNVAFLLAQQGVRLVDTLAASRELLKDRKFMDAVGAETGELPMQAAMHRGRGFSDQPGRVMHFESMVDRYPRMVAWVYEARKLGYKSSADMKRLIAGGSAKLERDRETVAHRSTESMVNFDRMGYWERQTLSRFLFVWPWVRGATAWPFWYAKNHPERAAFAAAAGSELEERRKRMLGNVPVYSRGLTPGEVHGTHARVVNASPLSPTSTAVDEFTLISDIIASLTGRKPDSSQVETLIGLFSPTVRDAVELGTQRDDFGRQLSLKEIISTSILTDFVPPARLLRSLLDADAMPRAFESNTGLGSRAARTFLRINPQTVSIPWLNAQAQKKGEKSMTEKIDEDVAATQKAWRKLAPGQPFSQEMRKTIVRKQVFAAKEQDLISQKSKSPSFEPRQTGKGKWSMKASLSNYERAKIAFTVLQQYPSDGTDQIPSPDVVLRLSETKPGTHLGEEIMANWLRDWESLNSISSRIKTQGKQLSKGEAIAAEVAGRQ